MHQLGIPQGQVNAGIIKELQPSIVVNLLIARIDELAPTVLVPLVSILDPSLDDCKCISLVLARDQHSKLELLPDGIDQRCESIIKFHQIMDLSGMPLHLPPIVTL